MKLHKLLAHLALALLMLSQISVAHATSPEQISPANASRLSMRHRFGKGLVQDIGWSADGSTFVECTTAGIWLYSGKTLQNSQHINGSARCIYFDVSADGAVIIWTSYDRYRMHDNDPGADTVFVANTRTGMLLQLQLPTLRDERNSLLGLSISADGRFIGASDGWCLTVWELAKSSAITIPELPQYHHECPASNEHDYSVREKFEQIEVINPKTQQITAKFPAPHEHSDGILSPDGKLVSRGGGVIDVARTGVRHAFLPTESGDTVSAFSADSRVLAIDNHVGQDYVIDIWDLYSRRLKTRLKTGHTDRILAIAFSADGRLATASWDNTIRFFDLKTQQEIAIHQDQTFPMVRAKLSPDGKTLASTSNDMSYLWDVVSSQLRASGRVANLRRDSSWIYFRNERMYYKIVEIAFSSDSANLFTATPDGSIITWDVQTGKALTRVNATPYLDATFADEHSTINLYSFSEKHLRIYYLRTQTTQTLNSEAREQIYHIAPNVDNGKLAVDNFLTIELWDTHAGQITDHLIPSKDCCWNNILFKGNLLAVYANSVIEMWDVRTKHQVYVLDDGWKYHTIWEFAPPMTFSPDGSILAAASPKWGVINIWDVKSGKLIKSLKGHTDWITDLQFSADGSMLVSASTDGTVISWAVADIF